MDSFHSRTLRTIRTLIFDLLLFISSAHPRYWTWWRFTLDSVQDRSSYTTPQRQPWDTRCVDISRYYKVCSVDISICYMVCSVDISRYIKLCCVDISLYFKVCSVDISRYLKVFCRYYIVWHVDISRYLKVCSVDIS